MKFKIDENLPSEFAQELQSAGDEAHTVDAEGLSGSEDSLLMEHCKREQRILVTLDLDFANLQQYPPHSHPGIIVFRPPRQDKFTLISLLQRILPVLTRKSPAGQLWIVEADRIRYREQ